MKVKRLRHLLTLWITVMFAVVSAQVPAATPASPDEDPAFRKPAADADRYILGPGDVIEVFVWLNPDLSKTVPVLPDGTVSTPLVDGIVASGKTPVQLARAIEIALSETVRTPRVSVLVSAPKSSFSQVQVIGKGVAHQLSLAYQDGMKVMDAVLAAGGLTPFARGNKSKILRKVGGKEKEIPVKVETLMEKGDPKQNLPLQPGDILVVPESSF